MNVPSPASLKGGLFRRLLVVAVAIMCLMDGAPCQSQSAAAGDLGVAFEVASVKPFVASGNADGSKPFIVDKARVALRGVTTMTLVDMAYGARQDYDIERQPWLNTWVNSDQFTIQATMPEGTSERLVPQMLRTLLAQRFALAIHHESRVMKGYALVQDRRGPKFKEAPSRVVDRQAPISERSDSKQPASAAEDGYSLAFGDEPKLVQIPGGGVRIQHDRMTMGMLAARLSQLLDAPVIDQTALPGRYGVMLEIRGELATDTSDGRSPGGFSSELAIPSALRSIGLKLDPRRVSHEVVCIDHVERPTSD
jgi:uncharacterized protein (TIGR03435 family)